MYGGCACARVSPVWWCFVCACVCAIGVGTRRHGAPVGVRAGARVLRSEHTTRYHIRRKRYVRSRSPHPPRARACAPPRPAAIIWISGSRTKDFKLRSVRRPRATLPRPGGCVHIRARAVLYASTCVVRVDAYVTPDRTILYVNNVYPWRWIRAPNVKRRTRPRSDRFRPPWRHRANGRLPVARVLRHMRVSSRSVKFLLLRLASLRCGVIFESLLGPFYVFKSCKRCLLIRQLLMRHFFLCVDEAITYVSWLDNNLCICLFF